MPGFVKTKSDEAKWARAKEAAGKSTSKGSEGYWKLANYIFHKSEPSEKEVGLAKEELIKAGFGGMLQMSMPKAPKPVGIKSPMKIGKVSVQTPKPKKLPDATSKPSQFFKSEDFIKIKHPSVRKLRDFLEMKHTKRNLKDN